MPTTLDPPRRILVIDDTPAIHDDFRKILAAAASPAQHRAAALTASLLAQAPAPRQPAPHTASRFSLDSALQGEEGIAKVQRALADGTPYTLAFVDMRMPPGIDGLETVKRLWAADPHLQIVICTAYTDFTWNDISYELGASDRFLILKKPFDPVEVCQLAAALSEKARLVRNASRQVAHLEQLVLDRTAELRRLAHFDKLTNLPNRALLAELLDKLSTRAAGDPLFQYGILFLDFDRFKNINDSMGHHAGDQLLSAIADRLRAALDQSPTHDLASAKSFAARLGGDEFVVVATGISSTTDLTALADRLLAHLAAPYTLNNIEVTSTASIGIAVSDIGYFFGADLLRDADSAMYVAKAKGKARHALFDKDMHKEAVARLTLESDLRRALKSNALSLAYHPIVSLESSTLVSFETLVRWRHPTKGNIPPLDFIPIAEETGLIVPLGDWVLEESLRQLRAWTNAHPQAADLSISVNVSRKQLADPHYPDAVLAALRRHFIRPSRLNLEVTESTMLDDQRNARGLLQSLQDAGVRIHMDDFGTGYSSLNCLHGLPLDALKIDRSFIKNLSESRDYAAVVNAIILLAHNLHIDVIAEGVESLDHAALLSALDCDLAQGYLFAQPLPPDAAALYLTSLNLPSARRGMLPPA